MEVSLTKYSAASYALRIKAPAEATRVPNHFIVLLDNSGSMGDGDSPFGRPSSGNTKMDHVKRCLDAMLGCLSADDMLSIITFESFSVINLQCMSVTDAHKAHIQSVIHRISPQDMTNLSAGLGNVRTVLAAAPPTLKTGILLLTDGHINQGISEPTAVKAIIQDILRSRNGLSFHCIAYGNDHNDGLLKDIALETQGSYNIVNTLEDVATAFGDTLGGLMSCAAQNVKALLPADARVEGPFKTEQAATGFSVNIGDLYAGTERIILYSASSSTTASVQAHMLPLLTPTNYTVEAVESAERCIDIELTLHRYTCTALLQRIQGHATLNESNVGIRADIDAYAAAVADEEYNGNPLIGQLRAEVDVMRRAVQGVGFQDNAVLSQHISYYGLGRGFSTPARPPRINAARHAYFSAVPMGSEPTVEEEDEDPVHNALFQNSAQRMVSQTLRSASSHPTASPEEEFVGLAEEATPRTPIRFHSLQSGGRN
jgi:Mg-chelatase subunit ChlD